MILTPELASRMLDAWERRLHVPKGIRHIVFRDTLLESALRERYAAPRNFGSAIGFGQRKTRVW